jgi:hypothetical protein
LHGYSPTDDRPEPATPPPGSAGGSEPWWAEIKRLRAELVDEQAAHAKTIDNFEAFAESERGAVQILARDLAAARIQLHTATVERDEAQALLGAIKDALQDDPRRSVLR